MNYEDLQEEYNKIKNEKEIIKQKEKEFQKKLNDNNLFVNKKGEIEANQEVYAFDFGLLEYERYVGEKGALYVETVGLAEVTENQKNIFVHLMNKIQELIKTPENTMSKEELQVFINEFIKPFKDDSYDDDELEASDGKVIIELQGLLNLLVGKVLYEKTYTDAYKLDNLFLYKNLKLNDFEKNDEFNTFDFVLKSSREDQGDLMNHNTYIKLIKTKQTNGQLNKVTTNESFD